MPSSDRRTDETSAGPVRATGTGEIPRQDTRELYRTVISVMEEGILVVLADGAIAACNASAARILGLTTAQITGAPPEERGWDAIRENGEPFPVHERPGMESLRTGLPRSGVVMGIRRSDAGTTWITMNSQPLIAPGETSPHAAVVTFADITERKAALDAARRSAENFHALIQQSPDAIAVHRDARVVYANPSAIALLGYSSPGELIGRPILELMHPDDRPAVARRVADMVRTGGNAPPVEERFVGNGGRVVTFEATAMPVMFDGQPSFLVIGRDLTERRKMQEQLRQRDRLASVGTLSAGLAHELNNPLAYLVGNVAFAREEIAKVAAQLTPGSSPRDALEDADLALVEADHGASRIREVVRGLGVFARGADQGREIVDIQRVLDSAIDLVRNQIRHRARLTRSYEDIPRVWANEVGLRQVFVNLLVNAAQAVAEGDHAQQDVRVATRAARGQVLVEVSDTGAGIEPTELPRIFDPFFTTRPVGVGTGLGLSVCHGIVTGLGGTITAESERGKGTTFRVALPISDQPEAEPAASPAPARGDRLRVLVIDDEPMVTRIVGRLLTPAHEVIVCEGGRAALDRVAAGDRFDVILCDLMMPDLTGMEVHAHLSRVAPELAARMVFMTGGAFTPEGEQFLSLVQNPRLTKPFDPATLRKLVREVAS